jgi:hypothetical protein
LAEGQQMKTPLKWRCGLINLLDVQTYEASRLASISRCLTSIGISITLSTPRDESKNKEIENLLSIIINECDFLQLYFTKKGAERFLHNFKRGTDSNLLAADLDALLERFGDEIELLKFFYVDSERFRWFEYTQHAGEQFKAKFPRANAELIEAGNCFALDRYTACVFHLTRALEIVLSSLHRVLEIPEEKDPRNNTWGRKLKRVSEKIEENDKNPPAEWLNDVEFYRKIYALLTAVKTPLRDDTVHIATIYDETGAGCVLSAMVAALNQIATKLSEQS